jgi:hypothetical protein
VWRYLKTCIQRTMKTRRRMSGVDTEMGEAAPRTARAAGKPESCRRPSPRDVRVGVSPGYAAPRHGYFSEDWSDFL